MNLSVRPYRPGETSPTLPAVAELLVAAVPQRDRKAARNLLVQRILPVKMAGLIHHPRPDRLAAVVHKELARVLSAKPPNMRLLVLKRAALDADMLAFSREAVHLAIARFLLQRPDVADDENMAAWIKPEVESMRVLTSDDLTEIAQERLRDLRTWQEQLKSEVPAEWEKQRARYMQVRSALMAADTGDFDNATGMLQDFVRDANARERRG